jgi:hypothetical protein
VETMRQMIQGYAARIVLEVIIVLRLLESMVQE